MMRKSGQKRTLLAQILHKTHQVLESPGSPASSSETKYGAIMDMDNDKIRTVCEKLLYDNRDRDRAVCDLTGLVKRSMGPSLGRLPQPHAFQPQGPAPRDLSWNPGILTSKSLCASTVADRPGSHISDITSTPSVGVSDWDVMNTHHSGPNVQRRN